MEDEKKQERSFELRSEKVRSIVGQIPSSLIRYGITAIAVVLFSLFTVAYFLPYRQVYSGVAIIKKAQTQSPSDSTDITLMLKFEDKRLHQALGLPINLQSPNNALDGRILSLSDTRDTLERQKALCRFNKKEIEAIEDQAVDFHVVQTNGTLLQKLLGDIGL
jgi:hypothetical protein